MITGGARGLGKELIKRRLKLSIPLLRYFHIPLKHEMEFDIYIHIYICFSNCYFQNKDFTIFSKNAIVENCKGEIIHNLHIKGGMM